MIGLPFVDLGVLALSLHSAGVGALSSEPLYTKRARAQSLPPLSDPSIVLRYYLTAVIQANEATAVTDLPGFTLAMVGQQHQ